MKRIDLSALRSKWPSPFVARTAVKDFSGGLLNEKSLANMDSQGAGPEGRFRVGRKIVYPVDSLIKWMESRSSTQD